ncbi:MAG: hypothetical protein L6R41_006351 [Letrouitia leprolyta]|nr:MAG: hypothetical protein L6R41_006351 [Letrouitia leprolyta]
MSKPVFNVCIVGAGLGGLAAAIGITRAGHRVTILEQAGTLSEIGAGIQVPPNSSRILERWGLLDKVKDISVQPRDFVLRSYRDGTILSKQNMVPYAVQRYAAPYLHIHRADYHKILVAEAERLGVKIILGSTVSKLDFERPLVYLNGKPEFYADVVIGADGLKSKCREAMLGYPDPPRFTGNLAYRIIVKVEDMKSCPDLSELTEEPAIHYWMGPQAHAVCYFLQGGRLCNLVLLCPDDLPEMVNTAKADIQEMREFFRAWDPKLQQLLGLVQETSKWRLQNSEELESWSHTAGKFVLLGDACHATLPYLAQGAAQAVEDGAVLGALFDKLEHTSQLHDALIIYERLRKSRTTAVVKGSTHLQDVFHMPDGPRQQERDWQLTQMEPFEGYPNPWADPVFQPYLFGYDADKEVEEAWAKYKTGEHYEIAGFSQSDSRVFSGSPPQIVV